MVSIWLQSKDIYTKDALLLECKPNSASVVSFEMKPSKCNTMKKALLSSEWSKPILCSQLEGKEQKEIANAYEYNMPFQSLIIMTVTMV